MVFGIRVSYHASQVASAKTPREPPLCPCARCFNSGSDEEELRAACESPAREIRIPCGHHPPNPFSANGRTKTKLGFGLKRRRSVDTVASDMRPLRDGVQDVPVAGGDGQSVREETT